MAQKYRANQRIIKALTEFAKDSDEEFVIPEDLSTLSDEDLEALSTRAYDTFDALYGDGQGLSDDDVTACRRVTSSPPLPGRRSVRR